MFTFPRIDRLPPYVFNEINRLKLAARQRGEDVIDFGMGNPDLPTPKPIVDKLIEAATKGRNHRYSLSRGIPRLRAAICDRYERLYGIKLDPETEAVATIGSKEGLSHLLLAALLPGDSALVPTPAYPIHTLGVTLAGADLRTVSMLEPDGSFDPDGFFDRIVEGYGAVWPRPKLLLLSFPNNPTGLTVERSFFERIVGFAKETGIMVVHDFAYADLGFDGYEPVSFLSVDGAKDVGVEFYTLSKGYSMPGWRVGFTVGNREIVGALTRIKSYLDYGMFQPIQIAATVALNGDDGCVGEAREVYHHRRDVLVEGLNRIGWPVERPKATMFVWAPLPPAFREMGSLAFSRLALERADVALAPGVGFGADGEGFVRFALVENEQRIRQAVRNLKALLAAGPPTV